jgi:hypothetical protein
MREKKAWKCQPDPCPREKDDRVELYQGLVPNSNEKIHPVGTEEQPPIMPLLTE